MATSDRVRSWLSKKCPGGEQLTLEREGSMGSLTPVASWARSDVDEARELGNPGLDAFAALMLDEAQQYADGEGEVCRFQFRWMDAEKRPLASIAHRCKPSPGSEVSPIAAATMNANDVIKELLKANTAQQKQVFDSLRTVLDAATHTLALQAQQLKLMHEENLSLRERGPIGARELTPIEQEEVRARTKALSEATALIPQVGAIGLQYAVKKFLPELAKLGLDDVAAAATDGSTVQ